MPDNDPGLIPRPADLVGALPGVDAQEFQERAERATEGVATGTPPIGARGGAAVANPGLVGQLGAVVGSFGVQNTELGREVQDTTNSALGALGGASRFESDLIDSGGDGSGTTDADVVGTLLAKLALLVAGVAIALVAINAFAGGLAEGLVDG